SISAQTPLSNPLSHCCNLTADTWCVFSNRLNSAKRSPISRLHKYVGRGLNQQSASVRSSGCGSINTVDIAQSKVQAVIPFMQTVRKSSRGNQHRWGCHDTYEASAR